MKLTMAMPSLKLSLWDILLIYNIASKHLSWADADMLEDGDQRLDVDYGHNRIAFADGTFAVYLSTFRHTSSDGINHQGDFLRFYDENGQIIKKGNTPKGWKWGVSHSFSKALCHDGQDFNMIACGDAYPRGLAYSRVLLKA